MKMFGGIRVGGSLSSGPTNLWFVKDRFGFKHSFIISWYRVTCESGTPVIHTLIVGPVRLFVGFPGRRKYVERESPITRMLRALELNKEESKLEDPALDLIVYANGLAESNERLLRSLQEAKQYVEVTDGTRGNHYGSAVPDYVYDEWCEALDKSDARSQYISKEPDVQHDARPSRPLMPVRVVLFLILFPYVLFSFFYMLKIWSTLL